MKPKIRLRKSPNYEFIDQTIASHRLNTVCTQARCPNIYECWDRRTATIMILGSTCTRSCGFCSITTGKPDPPDVMEPINTAHAVKKMNLKHVVLTSVDRDDIKPDFGAAAWSETIKQVKKLSPKCSVEVLTPDFQGSNQALKIVFEAEPDIFSHNVECVERISKRVRIQSNWQRSLNVLKSSVENGILTKTGMMVGLGETESEVIETMKTIIETGVKIFTIGQYLQPTKFHLPVSRYVEKNEFEKYKMIGLDLGFKIVESGPLVRSSYHADEQAENIIKGV